MLRQRPALRTAALALLGALLSSASVASAQQDPEPQQTSEPSTVLERLTEEQRQEIRDDYGMSAEDLLALPVEEAASLLMDGRHGTVLAGLSEWPDRDVQALVNTQLASRAAFGFETSEAEMREYISTPDGAESLAVDPMVFFPGEEALRAEVERFSNLLIDSSGVADMVGFGASFASPETGSLEFVVVKGSPAASAAEQLRPRVVVTYSLVALSDLSAIEAELPGSQRRLAFQPDGSLSYNTTKGGPTLDDVRALVRARFPEVSIVESQEPIVLPEEMIPAYCQSRFGNTVLTGCGQNRGGGGYVRGGEACSFGPAMNKGSDLGYGTARHCLDQGGSFSIYQSGWTETVASGIIPSSSQPDVGLVDTRSYSVTSGILRYPNVDNSRYFIGIANAPVNTRVCAIGIKAVAPRCGVVTTQASSGGDGWVAADSNSPVLIGDSGGIVYLESNPSYVVGVAATSNLGSTWTFEKASNLQIAGWGFYYSSEEGGVIGQRNHLFSLYDAALRRYPDSSGWNHYMGRWDTNSECQANLRSDSRHLISSSTEMNNLYPLTHEPLVEARLFVTYQALLGRDPDAGGLAWWTDYIWNGGYNHATRWNEWLYFLDHTVTNAPEFDTRVNSGTRGDRRLCD